MISFFRSLQAFQPDWAALLLRLIFGGFMLTHGYNKLTGFAEMSADFPDPIGVGPQVSLGLTVFAEFFCALLLVLGVLTRFAAIPLIICMLVIAFVIHGPDPIGDKEHALLFLGGYVAIFLYGPGKFSLGRFVGIP